MICINKKLAIGGGALLVFMFLLLILANLMPGRQPAKQPAPGGSMKTAADKLNKNGTPLAPRLNNDQVSTLILQWANNTRTEQGSYASGEDCNREGACLQLYVNNSAGISAMWARFKYYLKSNNVEAIDIVRKDIKTYVDDQKVVTIQPYFWNCKLLYEMFRSDALTQDEKYGVQTICARSIYNSIELSPKDISFTPDAVIREVQKDLSGPDTKAEEFFTASPDIKKLDEYAVQASERAAMYQWAKDEADLKEAELNFVAAVHALRATPDTTVAADEASVVGLAAIDMNTVMPSTQLVAYAKTLYGRYKDTPCSAMYGCVMRAYFYHELYKLEKKEEYKTMRDKVVYGMYDAKFDYQETKGYFVGKQAFYDLGLNYSYDMIPNSMLAGLLLDM